MQVTVKGHAWTVKDLTREHRRFVASDAMLLGDVYKRYSSAKDKAYRYCMKLFKDMNGDCIRIVSANTFQFTVGFEFDGDNGKRYFAYITKTHDYIMALE